MSAHANQMLICWWWCYATKHKDYSYDSSLRGSYELVNPRAFFNFIYNIGVKVWKIDNSPFPIYLFWWFFLWSSNHYYVWWRVFLKTLKYGDDMVRLSFFLFLLEICWQFVCCFCVNKRNRTEEQLLEVSKVQICASW